MQSITVSRTFPAKPSAVRTAIQDLKPFIAACGFDDVAVDGDTIHVANQVGIATIELTLVLVPDADCALAYEQQEGIFKEMRTEYTVTETEDGSEIRATTHFALDVAVVGEILDSTIIKRQRRKELEAQFDWIETRLPE